MAERVIVPYISYEGEGKIPATGRYVIWYRCRNPIEKTQLPELVECHLAYTDVDGKLHPLGDKFLNPSFNKVTLEDRNGRGDLFFTIENFKPLNKVKETSRLYDIPVRFESADFVGMFFVRPDLMNPLQHISVKTLLENDLIREGKILRGRNCPQYLPKGVKIWIALPCDYPIYLARMRSLIKELDKRLQAARNRIGFLMACSSLVDQAGNLVAARGRNAKIHYSLKLPIEKKRLDVYVFFETRLLQWELIDPLKERISLLVKKSIKLAKERINEVAEELSRLLKSPRHNKEYNRYWERYLEAGNDIPEEVRDTYMRAYSLLSRWEGGIKIYDEHIKNFLHQCGTTDENEFKKALKSIKEKASWVKDLQDGIYDIVVAYGSIKLSKEIKAMKDDLLAASRFLERKGIVHNINILESDLKECIEKNKSFNVDKYYTAPKRPPGIQAFIIGVNALIAANILMKEHKTIKEKIESTREIVGIMADLDKIKWLEVKVPSVSVVSKVATPILSVLDFGLGARDLIEASDTGNGTEFSLAAVSYLGKTIVLGGTIAIFLITGPFGPVLAAVGQAINLLSDFVGFVISYKSVDLKKYESAFEKIKELDKGDEIHVHFRVLSRKKVSETEYYKKLIEVADPKLKKAIDEKWTSTFGKDPLRLEDIVKKYFNNHYWGLIEELT